MVEYRSIKLKVAGSSPAINKKQKSLPAIRENGLILNHFGIQAIEARKAKIVDWKLHGGPQAFTARKVDGKQIIE